MKNTTLITLLSLVLLSCGSSKTQPDSSSDSTAQTTPESVRTIGVTEARALLESPEIITIDLRTPEEVAEGYIPGADLFIDFYDSFESELQNLDKSQSYLIYCRSGGRSGEAAELMRGMSFSLIYNLDGGIENWPQDEIIK